ncbi:hypothetical protein NC651_021214 [Populus alba x Populus x berolinensis]|nr:hypothetical protein NC651_021214 [Populus alba x Populus x berolinensis]
MGDRLVAEVHQWKIWAETVDTRTQSSSFKHVPKKLQKWVRTTVQHKCLDFVENNIN